MPRLLIGNEFNEDRAALAEAKRRKTAWWTHRLMWFAEEGDILVVAVAPEPAFVDYVLAMTGVPRSSVRILVPPPGELGIGVLTADRLAQPDFLAQLRGLLHGEDIDEVIALHPDSAVVELARALDLLDRLPGSGFLSQEGARLAGSKAVFRAVAEGTGVPVPPGTVCTRRADAARHIGAMLTAGELVMLKHDMRSGGRGNEILSPVEGVVPVGAQRAVTISGEAALLDYLADRWDWLTSHDRSPLVVERYYPDSISLFAEFWITDKGPRFGGQGELISAPLAAAEIIPAPDLDAAALTDLIEGGRRLSEALYAMGYRGVVSADAIRTPAGAVLFTEYNGRITGSTPAYHVIGKQVVGSGYAEERVLFDRDGWPMTSFSAARDKLADAGLAYDPVSRTGVVLVMPFNTGNDTLRYCVVEKTMARARECVDVVESLAEVVATTPDSAFA